MNAILAAVRGTISSRLRSGNRRLGGMIQVAAIIANAETFEEKVEDIVDLLAAVSSSDLAVLWREDRDDNRMELVASLGYGVLNPESASLLLGQNSASGKAFRQGTAIVIDDYSKLPEPSAVVLAQGIKSAFAIPILSLGQTRGLLSVGSRSPGHFDRDRVALLTAFANAIVPLFESADLSESLQASNEEMALVDEIARIVTSTLRIQDVYERFATEIKKFLVFDRFTIAAIDHDLQTVEVKYTYGDIMPGRNVGDVILLGKSATFLILAPRAPIFQDDISTATDKLSPVDEEYLAFGFRSSAVVPLISRGHMIGSMGLRSRKVAAFGPREQSIILRLADQIAPAIENANLYEKSLESEAYQRRLADENAFMAEIARIIASPFSTDGVYDQFAGVVQNLIPFDRIAITSCDNEGKFVDLHVWGTEVTDWAKGDMLPAERPGFASAVVEINGPLITPTETNELGDEHPSLLKFRQAGLRCILGCTLVSNDRLVGTIYLSSKTGLAYTDHDCDLLQGIANQIAGSIASATLLRVERERNDDLEALFAISEIMTQPWRFEVKAQETVDILVKVLDADQVSIRRYEDSEEILHLIAISGSDPVRAEKSVLVSESGTATDDALVQRRTIVINNYPNYPDAIPSLVAAGLRSAFLMPIISADRTLGMLSVGSKTGNHFNGRRIALLSSFANSIGTLFETADLSKVLEASQAELALADEISKMVTSTVEIQEIYEKFASELQKLVDFDRIVVNFIDHDAEMFFSRFVAGEEVAGREQGSSHKIKGTLVERLLQSARPIMREDFRPANLAMNDWRFIDIGLRASLGIPLISNGIVVATLHVHSNQMAAFGAREQAILERVANQITPAVENALLTERALDAKRSQLQLAEELSAKNKEIELTDRVSRIMTSSSQIDDVYSHFSDELKKLISFDRIVLNVIDNDSKTYVSRFVAGVDVEGWEQGSEHDLKGTPSERLINLGTSIVRDDLRAEKIAPSDDQIVKTGMRSSIAIPLVGPSGIIASLHLHSKQVAVFGSREQAILNRVANQITPAIANALLSDTLIKRESRSRALMEASSDAVITIDEAGFIRSINRTAEQVFGYPAIEMVGQNFSILMPERGGGEQDDRFSFYRANGTSETLDGASRKLDARQKDGTTIAVELWVGAIESDDGKGFIAIIRRLDQAEAAEEFQLEVNSEKSSVLAPPRLTNRENEVLHILADGGRNKDIAAEMIVSLHTVKFHI